MAQSEELELGGVSMTVSSLGIPPGVSILGSTFKSIYFEDHRESEDWERWEDYIQFLQSLRQEHKESS